MAAKTVEERLQRVEDVLEIYNLMGRYPYYGMATLHWKDKDETWAKKVPVRIYLGEQGYWEGYDALQRVGLLPKDPKDTDNPERTPGMMAMHIPMSPVVEIAGDGKTAKGVWIGMGLLAMKNQETGEPKASWEWDKYGIDFIKEDGKWKVRNQHIYRLIHAWGEDEKFADVVSKPDPEMGGRGFAPPDGPAIDDNPYRPDTLQELVPKPPEPYETWDDVEPY